ncbi:xylan 1,4-beta-xylosidase [Streptomyces sp. YC504]|uniref:Xylan 1,4-beta-xylosidase n=1 Tax=Streptomyces mesophilus TaxID=1775132 RepID=A0A6G4XTV5_9ACTN|nr:xylan 1,4-beta-xylosidase [Streptomyces mesophilus]NGO80632.1 xylan 1,4-beta-xylosidase [Streptomyces mesophilus]
MGRHGWKSGARRWRLTALLGVGLAALALVLTLSNLPDGNGSTAGTTTDGDKVWGSPTIPTERPEAELGWGFTHTEHSADEGEDGAVERAEKTLTGPRLPQLQHIMGWGSDNPEPSPGRYRFGEMDARMDFIRATGSTPVVTLCCAPDWMKGGKAGVDNTDWDRLETPPDPRHFKDFAKLAATVAKRYPDVRHFIVWNEFKGFWNDAEERWDYEGYTQLYNLVYRELKKVNEDILVGGPYLVMDSLNPRQSENASDELKGDWGSADQRVLDAFDHWNKNKAGADFVVVDGSSYTAEDELIPDEFAATEKFTDVSEWVRGRSDGLPLWWAEYYVEPGDHNDNRDDWAEPHRVAVQAAGLIAMARGGTTTAFYWNPQKRGKDCAGCLWTSTELDDGGVALPMLGLLERFHKEFPPGTSYEDIAVSPEDASVRVLADDKALLVVNTVDRPTQVTVDGKRLTLKPYEVHWAGR